MKRLQQALSQLTRAYHGVVTGAEQFQESGMKIIKSSAEGCTGVIAAVPVAADDAPAAPFIAMARQRE